jgi:hypothetical protein
MSKCDDCKRPTHIDLLDAVLLDVDGNNASEKLYCEQCWPKHRIVPGDIWRSATPSISSTHGSETP